MKRLIPALAVFVFVNVIAGVTTAAASAEPEAEHVVGDQCVGADIGRKDVAPNGQVIICDSNYHWEQYVGQVPSDPWVAAQH